MYALKNFKIGERGGVGGLVACLTQGKEILAFGHAHAYLSALAYLAPKKRSQRFF